MLGFGEMGPFARSSAYRFVQGSQLHPGQVIPVNRMPARSPSASMLPK